MPYPILFCCIDLFLLNALANTQFAHIVQTTALDVTICAERAVWTRRQGCNCLDPEFLCKIFDRVQMAIGTLGSHILPVQIICAEGPSQPLPHRAYQQRSGGDDPAQDASL